MRVFAAIPIEGELGEGVSELIRDLARRFPDCRWVRPDNLHVTLRFFGEIPDDSLDEVIEFVRRGVAGAKPEPISLSGCGMFRNRDRAAIWLGLEDVDWMKEVSEKLSGRVAGVPAELRPFKAHLTLGRMRIRKNRRGEAEAVIEAVEATALPQDSETELRCVLYQSELSERGARYRELWRACLAGL